MIALIIGYLALIFVILSFQANKRLYILLLMCIAQSLFFIHFYLLNAWTAALLNLIGAIRCVIFMQSGKVWADLKIWPIFFLVLYWMIGWLVWEGWYSILPLLAVTFGTLGLWMKKPRYIRLVNLIPRPLWFTYNFIVKSYPGMTTEIFVLFSIVIGIIRYDIIKKR